MALALILTGAALCYAQSPAALIREMTGTVEIKKSGSTDWVAAKTGDTIEKSTVISTGFRSMALLAVGSSTVMVRPLTRLSLEELMNQGDTEEINIGLRTGRVQVDVKAPAGSRANFSVQTPSSTASVRGTMFDMTPLNIQVKEGTVVYRGSGEPGRAVRVKGGQSSLVDDNGRAVNPYTDRENQRAFPALAGQAALTKGEQGGTLAIDPALVIGQQGYMQIGLGLISQ